MNWRGRLLPSDEVMVQTMAATITQTGLTVHAEFYAGSYPHWHRIPDRRSAGAGCA